MLKQICFRLPLLLLCLLLVNGCAIMNKENRVLLNAMDESLSGSFITKNSASKIASAPLVGPVAICAGILDTVVTAPVRAVGPAVRDTDNLLWDNPEGSDIRQAMLFIPKTVATPVVFLGSWGARSLFTTKF